MTNELQDRWQAHQRLIEEHRSQECALTDEVIDRALANAAETIREVEDLCRGDLLGRFGGPMKSAA